MKKVVVGVVIMMLGVFLLFHNLGFISSFVHHLIISWQALLIAIGAVLLFDRKKNNKNAGTILIFIGTVFLLPKIFGVHLFGILIPLLIIIAGIFCIIKATTGKNPKKFMEDFDEMPFKKTTVGNGGVVKREYTFTGSKEQWTYGKLKNVEIAAVFSGVELDLTQTELAEDIKVAAHIKISSVFSGVTLYVPEDWNITIQKTGIFGGFVDNRPHNAIHSNSTKMVVLEVEAVFGGGEIKCYE